MYVIKQTQRTKQKHNANSKKRTRTRKRKKIQQYKVGVDKIEQKFIIIKN